jgi:Putative peptidoglycan binding domain
MSLPTQPPRFNSWSELVSPIKKGETGWRVWALQSALSADPALKKILADAGAFTTAQGVFGAATETAVKKYQRDHFTTVDGIVGPKTQGLLLKDADLDVHQKIPKLPNGILSGFTIAEGGSVLAATNWYTPPGGTPGVDCGPVQWRQYGPPFSEAGLKKAFNPRTAFEYAGNVLLERIDDYNRRRPSLSDAMVLRLAILAHNWPAGAEQVVKYGHLTHPDALASWTTKPGGGHYTQGEWLQEYPDRILMYVK